MKVRYPLAYLSALFVVAAVLSSSAKPRASAWIAPAPAGASSFQPLPDIVGTWAGTWADTVYFVAGNLNITINRDGDSYFATGTIDVSAINPTLGILSGTANATGTESMLSGTFSCPNLGSGTVQIVAPLGFGDYAMASGSGTVGAPLSFGPFTFAGDVITGIMVGGFDFTNPSGGKGIAALTQIPDAVAPATWSEVKAKYGE
jgi:hypothetical protein